MERRGEITVLLDAACGGDRDAMDAVFDAVYGELHALARRQRNQWQGDYTLNTTALVHEAYVKLVDGKQAQCRNRAHFFAVAARAMRQIMVNYAEQRVAAKRGGGAPTVPLTAAEAANPVSEESAPEVIALHEALERLEGISERQSRVVECRFFTGLPIRETADALGVSVATVKRDWNLASAWLHRELHAQRDG